VQAHVKTAISGIDLAQPAPDRVNPDGSITRMFTLRGERITEDELVAICSKTGESDHELRALKTELGLNEASEGEDLDAAAKKLLASRGIWQPTSQEYVQACLEVGAR
jgi:hypothetical protein